MSAFDVRDLLKAAGECEPGSVLTGSAAASPMPPAEALAARRASAWLSPVVLAGVARLGEFFLVIAIGVAALAVRPDGFALPDLPYALAITAIAGLTTGLLQFGGAYRIGAFRHFAKGAVKLVLAWSLAFLVVAVGMVLAKEADHFSRLWLISFFAIGLGALLAGRFGLLLFVGSQMRRGVFDRRTAIVGGGESAEELIRALEASGDASIRLVGIFDDRNNDRSSETVLGVPKLGNVADLVAFARRSRVDLIVFTLPITAEGRILQMLAKLWVLPIDIRLSAHATKLRLRPRAYSYLGAVPVLDIFDKPLADWDVILKGAFDRVVALALIVVLSPVLLGIALAVKLTSRGPILFRQQRHGFNNESIQVLKFRSMYVDQCDHAVAKQVTRDDPRVTPVGRILRKSSLDELPQLFNVLKGDLSLVGPRPHVIHGKTANALYDQVVDGYFARHRVKPGITGWAQINGWRGETDTSEKIQRRVEHDLYYIENWSIALDLQILFTTPIALLRAENAY